MAAQLESGWLEKPGPQITVDHIDFEAINLKEYKNCYAVVLDNVLSKAECDQLLAAAESTTGNVWERAMVNIGGGKQAMYTDIRNCGRIVWDDKEVVGKIWERIKSHVPEIETLFDKPHIAGLGPSKRKEVWELTRPNERMRFLKYEGGEYFNIHGDGMYVTPDNTERSYYTMHLYLNERGPDNDLVGGATTFFGYDEKRLYNVDPKIGRVLIFQHRNLLHAGQEVDSGTKYTMRTDLMFKLVDGEKETLY